MLVLNRSFLPIHLTTVKRAVRLLSLDVAVGVDGDYQTYSWEDLLELPQEFLDHPSEPFYRLRSISREIPIPKALVLQSFDRRPPQHIRFSRSQVFLRDKHTCQYCNQTLPKQKLNIDHVVPRTQGGKTTWENVVTSCHYCNRRKGGRTPVQAGMRLLSTPHKPAISPLLKVLKQVHPIWNTFFPAEMLPQDA